MTIYLYKKTHNVTGFKYLGKTIKNPQKYKGSGKTWMAHIKEYGYDVTTEIIKECNTISELSYWGRYYSKLWDIVNSKEWANRIPETGGGPGRSGYHKGELNPMFGKTRNDLKSESSPNKNHSRREQSRQQMRMQWRDINFRESRITQFRELWTDPEYIQKMKNRPKPYKKVIINGIIYSSLKEAAAALNLDPSTVSRRCSSHHEKFAEWKYA
jgi:hypothetical protein